MKALVVEDEMALREQLVSSLQAEGYIVDQAGDGREAAYFGTEFDYDVVILDLGLPGGDGLTVLRGWREAERGFPVLILTARDSWQDKVTGLEAGADDYVTKPFHLEEIHARLQALQRRAAGHASSKIVVGPFTLDTGPKELTIEDEVVELTAFEYRVIEYLMVNSERVISKEELTERLYAQDFERDSNTIEVFIGRLRKKLDPDGERKPIRTIRGQGYRFSA